MLNRISHRGLALRAIEFILFKQFRERLRFLVQRSACGCEKSCIDIFGVRGGGRVASGGDDLLGEGGLSSQRFDQSLPTRVQRVALLLQLLDRILKHRLLTLCDLQLIFQRCSVGLRLIDLRRQIAGLLAEIAGAFVLIDALLTFGRIGTAAGGIGVAEHLRSMVFQ